MAKNFAIYLILGLVVTESLNANSFARQLLASELLQAEQSVVKTPGSGIFGRLLVESKSQEEISTSVKTWQEKQKKNLDWLGTVAPFNIPLCPNIISLRCLIFSELKEARTTGASKPFLDLMAQLRQRQHPIIQEEDIALIYSAMLVEDGLYNRSLLILFPLVKNKPSLIPAYEWVQRLYNHSDRDDGKVAIKNL